MSAEDLRNLRKVEKLVGTEWVEVPMMELAVDDVFRMFQFETSPAPCLVRVVDDKGNHAWKVTELPTWVDKVPCVKVDPTYVHTEED